MVVNQNRIINYDSFSRDCKSNFKSSFPVIMKSPISNTLNQFTAENFEHLVKEIIKESKNLPHKKCALIYKINENSNLSLEIQPVTDSA